MPLYEYACPEDHTRVEHLRLYEDRAQWAGTCEECGLPLVPVISAQGNRWRFWDRMTDSYLSGQPS